MAAKIFTSKTQLIIFIVAITLAVLVLIPVLFINSYLKPVLTQKLKEAVAHGTDSLYRITFSDADLHVFRGNAMLYDIVLKPDTAVYHRLKRLGKAPNNLYELRVKHLSVNNVGSLKLYFNKKLEVGQITLTAPQIFISKHLDKQTDTSIKDKRTLYQKISKSLKFIRVNEIKLDDVHFTYTNYTGKIIATSSLNHMALKATDLLIDSATQADTSRTWFCEDITARLNNFNWQTANGLYRYKVKSVTLSTQASRLTATGLVMQPLAPAVFFAKSRDDRFAFNLDTVILNNFDYQNYHQKGSISISDLVIGKGFFEVYSNPNGPLKTTDRLVTFPHWAIRNVKTDLKIDTLRLKNIDVAYKEFHKQSQKTGSVRFEHAKGRFLNITNNKEALKTNNICKAFITSRFMGAGKFDLSFTFNLSDADYKYNYKGTLGPMDMRAANPAVMPLGMVQITSGAVKSLNFNISSTQKTSVGQVILLYNDLKVNVLRKDDEKGYSKKGLLSLFANSFVLKSNNPDDAGKSPRSATVKFIRPSNFPFFQTVWLTILDGIKSCAMGKAVEKDADADEKKKAKQKAAEKAKKDKEKKDKKFKEKLKQRRRN